MPNNQCTKTTSCSNIPIAKVRKKDVQTITDPWTPVCQKCLEREHSKVISTIDISEYTKALNYINSIHSLLNESLSKQSNGNSSTTLLKKNFSMPDLPNFLTMFSCLTSNSSSVTTANKQSNTNNNHLISRTTSTSSISNCIFNVAYDTQITQTVKGAYEDFEENNNSDLCNSQGDDDNAQHEGNTQQTFDEIFDSEVYHDMAPSEFEDVSKASTYYTALDIRAKNAEDSLCTSCLSSTNRNYALSAQKSKVRQRQQEKLESQSPKPIAEKAIEEIPQGDGKKAPPRCPTQAAQAKRIKKGNIKKQPVILEGSETSYERLLSDAELDRYASELLIGKEFEFCNECQTKACTCYSALPSPPRSAGDKPRSLRNRGSQIPNIDAVKKKPLQRPKEMLTQFKEKQITGIPVKQGTRPMSPSNKLRLSSSGSSPTKPNRIPIANSASFTMQGSMNVRNIKTNPGVVRSPNESLTRDEKHEINKQKLKTVLNNRAQVLQFELANAFNVIPQRIKKNQKLHKALAES
ncbi:hypothetical protein ILUMI_26878 [Ignelater luminosus]|uniref:Uncharacterized protein n=1 Tax=Ignelater luminosus TaxID=2038154 RepID=A0A8K0FY89_IGNLU|nr:hypothetical protein ILUMI_26878 [Ignelater luminosus]